jgi:hypothetical protein
MSDSPKIDGDLVTVFDTRQESEAMVIQGLLSSGGIESIITALDAPQDVLPGVGGVVVRVNPAQAEQAREIIAEYSSADDSVELEEDDSESESE